MPELFKPLIQDHYDLRFIQQSPFVDMSCQNKLDEGL